MPIIGSLDGTYGHGRGPQLAPPPGFTFFPRISNRSTWVFTANGTFSFNGNTTNSENSSTLPTVGSGNVFVITPNSTFLANVKIWAAGGGYGGNVSVGRAVALQGGGGGAVVGQVLFQSGQEYTVVASGEAYNNSSRDSNQRGGGGGGASGIFKGNIFSGTIESLTPVVVAGGGGGAFAQESDQNGTSVYRAAGAGGGNLSAQLGWWAATNSTNGFAATSPNTVGRTIGSGGTGSINQVFPSLIDYSGAIPGITAFYGGGGGGYRGGALESGGQGYVDPDQDQVQSVPGFYSLPSLYDDSARGTAGDSAKPGRVMIYMDEYKASNIVATGGTVTDVPIPGTEFSYRYHTFTDSGRFTITSCNPDSTMDVFLVGGGGGSAGTAGAGGGSVIIKNSFTAVPTANYIVSVGAGGLASDSYASTGTGRIYGGYKGGDSAFYNNPLSSRGFPDSYIKLMYSFGVALRYISASGDDSNGLSLTTAFNSFESALTKTANDSSLIVFVVLQGTYSPVIPLNVVQTPINDRGKPRVFICAPGRVTINFSPIPAENSQRDCPMAVLENAHSAIYGATIVRNMFDTTDPTETAFFNNRADPGDYQIQGSFYNCVFRENQGKWALVYGPSTRPDTKFRIENCTFFTKDSNQNLTGISNSSESKVLIRNCAFNKAITTDAVQVNCVTNIAIGAKYVITGVTDKGVYAGEYGWGAAITIPERNAPLIALVARGGGGAPLYGVDSTSSELLGGCGPGNTGNGGAIAYLQPAHQANVDYSSFGYPGGRSFSNLSGGGGGAGSPAFDAIGEDSTGGLGLEWPIDSNQYYGTGGRGKTGDDIALLAPGTIGKGAGGPTPAAGNDGIVVVRYLIPGSYTAPITPPVKNLVAYGGTTKQTATYKEHLFTSSGVFYIVRPTNVENFYYDVIVIGGGGGGAGNNHYNAANPGYPGQVRYFRVNVSTTNQASQIGVVSVGAGGLYGYYHDEYAYGQAGSASSFNFGSASIVAAGGPSVNPWGGASQEPSVLITDGLFSDNTTRYGGSGGKFGNALAPVPGWGSYGSGGFGATPGGWHDAGSAGIPGAVIIRYPIYPTA